MEGVTVSILAGGVCLLLVAVAALVAVLAVVQTRKRRETRDAATGSGWRFGVSQNVDTWSQPLVQHVRQVHGGWLQRPEHPVSAIAVVETVRRNRRVTAGRFLCLTINPASPLSGTDAFRQHYQLVVVHLRRPHPPGGNGPWRVNGNFLYKIDDLGTNQLQQLDIQNVNQCADYLLRIAEKLEPSQSSSGA